MPVRPPRSSPHRRPAQPRPPTIRAAHGYAHRVAKLPARRGPARRQGDEASARARFVESKARAEGGTQAAPTIPDDLPPTGVYEICNTGCTTQLRDPGRVTARAAARRV